MKRQSTRHEYLAVDLMRGICALAVILWHYQSFYFVANGAPLLWHSRTEQPMYPIFRIFYEYGQFAVQFFWAISGFVFTATYVKHRNSARHFFVARFARLYPLHFATLIAVAVIQIVSMRFVGHFQLGGYNDAYHFVLNLFMASNWGLEKGFSFNAPIWSVSIEVVIYLIFFVTIPLVARSRLLVPAVLVVVFYTLQIRSVPGVFWTCGYYFYIGVLAFSLVDILGRASALVGVFGVALWVAKGMAVDQTIWFAIPLLAAACLIMSAAIDKSKLAASALQRLAWIGESTYSTYLLHLPLIMLILFTFSVAGIDRLPIVSRDRFFIPFIASVFLLGRVSYLHFELPMQHLIRNKLLPKGEIRSATNVKTIKSA
ncbi:acyltransferase family protein [Paraburkholderia sp. 2C]